MEKKEIIEQFNNAYLNEYKTIHKKEDRIIFFNRFLEIAKTDNIAEYILFFKGYIEYLNNNYDTAIDFFQKALEFDDRLIYSWHGLGLVYRKRKEYEKAIDAYLKTLQLDEKFVYPLNGLGNVYIDQKEYEKAIEAYQKAIQLDNKYAYPWCGLGKVFYFQKEYEKAINAFNKVIQLDDKYSYPWNGIGNVYADQKEYEKAIVAYNKAIQLDNKLASPWNGLGNVYSDQTKYEKAIEAYNKAIHIDDSNPYPWYGLGIVYKNQKEYEKAIEAYQKAIQLDNKYANPWIGLGNVYSEQKEYEKAIEVCQKAIQLDEKYGGTYYNLGLTYKKINNLINAKEYFEKAFQLFDRSTDKYWISLTASNLKEIENSLNAENKLKKAEKTSKNDPVIEILNKTKGFENKIFENQKTFLSFFDQASKENENRIYLKILRRWNSYTPIIADNFNISKGGGYFLKIKDKGIVIDPGFNFIDNFKGSGYKFDEIDYVIISHAHNDHTSDLESIITLLNKCNSRRKGLTDFSSQDTTRADIAKQRNDELDNIKDDEIEKEFKNSERRKRIGIYLTKSTHKKFSGMLELHSNSDYEYHSIEAGDMKEIYDKNGNRIISFKVLKAKHDDVISDNDSVGFAIDIENTAFIYTGDTGWSDEIEKQYVGVKRTNKDKEIILLAHLGGFKQYEKNYILGGTKEKIFYTNHLGRLGMVKLCQILEPKICFISEFGEELRNYRIEIAKIFHEIFKEKTVFFPADIDLEYDFVEKKIKAITGIDTEENEPKEDLIKPENVNVCLLRKDFSLHYFEKTTEFSESDLIQVLIENYDRSKK